MPDLSACYFCGTALDEPLSEYPVVPASLQPAPDQQRTVVLCSTCRRKLGQVVDTVVGAVAEQPTDDTVQQGFATADGDATEGEASAAVEEDEKPDERVDAKADGVSEEKVADERGVSDDDADGTMNVGADVDDADDDADEAMDDGWTTPTASSEDSATVEFNMTSLPGKDTDRDAETGDGSTATEDDADSPASGSGDATGSDDADDDEPSLTALEYTKVMRLLENRELPIDREEIQVVATNAYEIRPQEFDAIVDTAIERGLIVEENGQFVAVE